METTRLDVGIVGVGEMGRPMLDRLLGAGHQVTAYVRRADAAAELARTKAAVAESPAAMAAGRDVVIICVYSDQQVREVALGTGLLDAMKPGAVVVIHTTGSPSTAEALAARAVLVGVDVVDAPVSGGPQKIRDGEITLLVGGDEPAVERARPAIASYGRPIVHLGPLGAGQRVKLINNILFGAHIQLAVEAIRVGREFGLDAGVLANTIGLCSGASAAMGLVAAVGSPEQLVAAAGRFVQKDVVVARAVAAELGAELGALNDVTAKLLAELTPPGRDGGQ